VIFLDRGIARANAGDYRGAIADYSEAIRLREDFAAAWYDRGVAREASGDRDGAIADIRRAKGLAKPYSDLWHQADERLATLSGGKR
jgi:tetratricopeptide (TPR) repeat protein